MLREQGYDTYCFRKCHMSGDQMGGCGPNSHEDQGFTANWAGSGTCPSPNGGLGHGQEIDPVIRQQFVDWIGERSVGGNPWLATMSLINPHDIAEYPRCTRRIKGKSVAPSVYSGLPDTVESEAERQARGKPLMQARAIQIENEIFGVLPRSGSPSRLWTKMLDVYLSPQRTVDLQTGYVLSALANSPFANNTIVVFTSDHGENGGAHGMRSKGSVSSAG